MTDRYTVATTLLGKLRAALEELHTFVVANQVSIREVTGIPPPAAYDSQSIYTSSLSKALVLQIYVDSLGRNLGEVEADKLPV